MAKIVWSKIALEDLREVYDYIEKDSIFYAEKFIAKLTQKIEILENFPRAGRMVPEFENEKIRELIEGNYRIIYRIESKDEIGIARIHHSARILNNL